MQTSIATVSLSGGLAEKLEAIAAAGFVGVEIFESDLLSFNGTPRDVARLVASLGLRIVTFQPFRDFEGMPEPQRSRTFARAERKFDLMAELGCDLMMICSNVAPDSLGGIDRAAADFHELGERARKRGMRVGFEALAWGRHISDYRDAWEVVRRADHPAVGLTLDSFHIFARQTDLKAIRSIPRDKIALVQLADAPWLEMDVINWSRHFRCFPGQGDFPLLEFMDAVLDTGYEGLLSLEIFNDQFRAGSPRGVALDGQRSLIYLLDQLRGHRAPANGCRRCRRGRSASASSSWNSRPTSRPPASWPGCSRGSGFRKAGEHRSKAVTHWSQGAINLVLNSDKEGFAHSYQLTHGPSVCAMCLKVDSAGATLDRAEKLRDTPFRQAVGPGELEIPAVRGLGGSLLYFVDGRATSAGSGTSISRRRRSRTATAAQAWSRSTTSRSRCTTRRCCRGCCSTRSLFDVSKTPQLDVIDPGGIVRSQVIQSPDGALRIAHERLAEPADAVVALPRRGARLGRAARRLRKPRHRGDRQAAPRQRRRHAADAGELLRRPRSAHRSCRPSGSTCCAPTTSCTTATRRANTCRPTPPTSAGCSSSRSSSAAATRASARSTRRSGSPRRRGCPAPRVVAG